MRLIMETIKSLVEKLNKQLENEFKFNLDPIRETLAIENGTKVSSFLGFSNSIYNDFSVIPINFTQNCSNEVKTKITVIIHWINTKLFTSMLTQLIKNMCPLYTTEEVRLRIATNLIMKLNLPKNKKLEWIQHLQILYRIRRNKIEKYYEKEIAQLPF